MKIALYAGMFRRNQDGATRTLYRLVSGLVEQGHTVAVWAFCHDPNPLSGIITHTVPSTPLPLYREYRIAMLSGKNRRQLEDFCPDIVHITVPDLAGLALLNWADQRNIPVMATYHTDFPSYLKSFGLSRFSTPLWRYFRWFYSRCHIVLAPTDVARKNLEAHGIGNTDMLRRGIDVNQFSPRFRSTDLRRRWGAKDGQAVILFAGRLVWYKGLETFCTVYDLYHKYSQESPPLFVLAGSGPIEKELRERMPRARFCGHQSGRNLSRTFASADLLLFPSGTETFGNVILEALASGIPAVVSNQGGCRELVAHSQAGLVAPFGKAKAFYRACQTLLENPACYRICRQKGIDYTRDLSWDRIVNQLASHYKRLIPEQPVKRPQSPYLPFAPWPQRNRSI